METLVDSIVQFLGAGWDVMITLGTFLLPWTALGAWIIFWLFAVDWAKLRAVMHGFGWVGLVLIGLVMALVWSMVAPPDAPDGKHHLFGLAVGNLTGKVVYVTGLSCIMFLCGSVQLSGCCANCCRLDDHETDGAGSSEPQH